MTKQDSGAITGSLVTVIASLTLSDWGVILGIIFGASTLLLNWYYKAQEIKLKEKYYQKQVKDLDDDQN